MQHAHWDAEVKVRVGDFGGQVPRVAGYDACNDKPCSNCILIHCFVTLKKTTTKKQVQMIVITYIFQLQRASVIPGFSPFRTEFSPKLYYLLSSPK